MATMMPSLPQRPEKKDGLSTILMVGTSVFGGGTALYLILQLVREQPDQAFRLLQAWGPGYLLALFIAYALNKLLTKAVDMVSQFSERNSAAAEKVATQMQSIAVAMQTMADKDDRQVQEMQTLTSYTAQQSDRLATRIATLFETLQEISDKLDQTHKTEFDSINAKLDALAAKGSTT
jgi:DNA anti-recombination protein RmuC